MNLRLVSPIDWLLARLVSDFGRAVIYAIAVDPENWTTADGFRLCHPTAGFEIWIANRAYGLHVRMVGRGISLPYRPSWADRHAIWRVVKSLRLRSHHEIETEKMLHHIGPAGETKGDA